MCKCHFQYSGMLYPWKAVRLWFLARYWNPCPQTTAKWYVKELYLSCELSRNGWQFSYLFIPIYKYSVALKKTQSLILSVSALDLPEIPQHEHRSRTLLPNFGRRSVEPRGGLGHPPWAPPGSGRCVAATALPPARPRARRAAAGRGRAQSPPAPAHLTGAGGTSLPRLLAFRPGARLPEPLHRPTADFPTFRIKLGLKDMKNSKNVSLTRRLNTGGSDFHAHLCNINLSSSGPKPAYFSLLKVFIRVKYMCRLMHEPFGESRSHQASCGTPSTWQGSQPPHLHLLCERTSTARTQQPRFPFLLLFFFQLESWQTVLLCSGFKMQLSLWLCYCSFLESISSHWWIARLCTYFFT